jgi:hypothetical protein
MIDNDKLAQKEGQALQERQTSSLISDLKRKLVLASKIHITEI